jgi:4-amino-4-deoxy-L-arabinose transferase-like glycosyltransferase
MKPPVLHKGGLEGAHYRGEAVKASLPYWGLSPLRRYLPLITLAVAITSFYLYGLGSVGVLSTDEPRYDAIGHAMAQSGDWVTPKLWGAPWFEKPPLLYWMTAAGALAGLGLEAAGRLPVALLSLAFLGISFALLRREFGQEAALVSVALLATSAGWVAFSSLCITDLPLAAFFSLAVFLSLPLLRPAPDHIDTNRAQIGWRFLAIGACLGFAALAKGLVPIALAAPGVWFLRQFWRKWWFAAVACIAIAAPWYVAVYERNGFIFIQDFFIKHHFERIYSAALQHVQPWYYYFPVLLAGVFPWTPLLGVLGLRQQVWDQRRRFLLAIVLFGLLFFSVPLNKLPGYLLPLLPSLFVLLGSRLGTELVGRFSRRWLWPCALSIAAIPLLTKILPFSLIQGRLSIPAVMGISRTEIFYVVLPIVAVLVARRSWLCPVLVLCVVSAGFYLKIVADPILDQRVSARGLWRQIGAGGPTICDGGISRDWLYGLSFYRGALIPPCPANNSRYVLRMRPHEVPTLEPVR